ncbi:MAG: bifunctional diguanylate cyclase/phosphodiesterase [Lachnospiraceae bacterium]|nr:bifunctional diguanylate cyclase/phosphodiesterase [Lachnospiraceae bacterium]
MRKEPARSVFIVFIILNIIASVIVATVSRIGGMMTIGANQIPMTAFTGVFSSLANMCLIILVVLFKKKGLIASLILIVTQLPLLFINIFRGHNSFSIPGIFSTLLIIVSIVIIYTNRVRIDRYQAKVREQAVTDRLTGLPNRFACSELVEDLVGNNEKFAIVSVDINNFKSINDTMGHNTGNEVLRRIASRWKNAADSELSGTQDFVARLGGDEFALIIKGYTMEVDIVKTIRYYESVLENKLTIDDYDYFMTASFGYSEFPTDSQNGETLFSYADAAMYEVKKNNIGSHILRFVPSLLRSEHTLELEREIRTALENDTIYFNLQPQFDTAHNLRGFEALARMKDSNGNNVSPGEFIPAAEKAGLIDKVDSRVYRKAAEFFGEILRKTGADITLSINASVRHLIKNDFLDELRDLLDTYNIPARCLEVEITESVMLDSADKALKCLYGLKDMGIKIAIDDFGTGYSSLSYLNKVPADLLKIDKSFIDEMNLSESSEQYVAAIIAIGHIMNFKVISEGVETKKQLETLTTIDCDYIQGFFWGHPMPAEEAYDLVRQSKITKNK